MFRILIVFYFCFLSSCKKDSEACVDSSKIDNDAVCIEIYDPVCGCDSKTYSNTCYAERAGIVSWENGECI
ncbi:MAG: kazal domain protein [Bacteroidota bacterium]|nr:kazal domain protein [Bacteroidota bacterium]